MNLAQPPRNAVRRPRAVVSAAALLLGLLLELCLAPLSWAAEDPLEGLNRAVFGFNDTADRYVIRPIAVGYDAIAPTPVRVGATNFFNNINDINGAANALLQGRIGYFLDNTTRVLLNSTVGVLGLFDVATEMGVDRYRTDFGHTLAVWGAPQGDYIVVPFLGPATYRSGAGMAVDMWASPTGQLSSRDAQITYTAAQIINFRANLLGADQLLTGDRYLFFRDAFLQQRAMLVGEADAGDSFSDFGDDWESDDF